MISLTPPLMRTIHPFILDVYLTPSNLPTTPILSPSYLPITPHPIIIEPTAASGVGDNTNNPNTIGASRATINNNDTVLRVEVLLLLLLLLLPTVYYFYCYCYCHCHVLLLLLKPAVATALGALI